MRTAVRSGNRISAVENEEQVAYLHLQFGYDIRLTKDSIVNRDENPSPRPESALPASSRAAAGGRRSRGSRRNRDSTESNLRPIFSITARLIKETKSNDALIKAFFNRAALVGVD